MNEEELDLRSLRGLVATVVLTGSVDEHYAQSLSNVRSWCDRNGFHNIEWANFQAQLVEAGRDAVCHHALDPSGDGSENAYDWIIQIDADAAPIPEDVVAALLYDGFVQVPHADVVGAYCQLKNPPFLPTIDTGTGTWEPHWPGEGLLPVMRTGGHCLLIKTPILRRFGPPWFKTRRTIMPLDAIAELDNYARCKLDGENPLRESPAWQKLVEKASEDQVGAPAHVGEDSGFCDAVKAVGGSIYVNADLVVGHVGKRIISPRDLRDEKRKGERKVRAMCGLY